MLQPNEIANIEKLLVEFHDIFARHRFHKGTNEEFKVELTPKNDSPACSQTLPTPINLKEDILVELAILQRYGIITTLPFSKYASPIFAQKKPNGKLGLLVDLRKINNLVLDDYINNNHPVSTLTEAAQHMTGKKTVLQIGSLASKPLSADGGPRVYRDVGIQFCQQNLCVSQIGTTCLSRALSDFSSFLRENDIVAN